MKIQLLPHILIGLSIVRHGLSQFPPEPEGVTTLQSKFHPGITISYKESGVCETTPGVRSFSGYIHLPPGTLNETHEKQTYPINTFYWFFESRKDPSNAPLAIWLNGGPGGSSLTGALSENGPCFVNSDSNSTYLNPWSWNNEVNILYIDQPNQVGFSYDVPTNVTINLLADGEAGATEVADFANGVPEQNNTFFVGTRSSQNVTSTANSTSHAALSIWHFAQIWFEEFPAYKPLDEKINLVTESYGGRYGPSFVSYFMQQNELIANGTLSGPGVHYLHMDSLGIINGCIDSFDRYLAYIDFSRNNTYDIDVFTKDQYNHAMHEWSRKDGLKAQITECQRLEAESDPNDYGDIKKVNDYCAQAEERIDDMTAGIVRSGTKFGWNDVTHELADAFPPQYLMGFLNQHWVQKALGVPVNHTSASDAVAKAFAETGDMLKGGLVEDIAYILDHGVKVAMMYGDRDFACNWAGGEASSLKIPWKSQQEFVAAGYTPLVLSPVHSAGLVRQYGNLSFTRVYQAGHLVPSYQPEAAYEIFMRTLFNKDVATGTVDLLTTDEYATKGSGDAWRIKSDILPAPEVQCYVLAPMTCTKEHQEWLKDGSAIVKDWIVVGRESLGKKHETVSEAPGNQLPLHG